MLIGKAFGSCFLDIWTQKHRFDQGIQRVLKWRFGHRGNAYRESVWEHFWHHEIAVQNHCVLPLLFDHFWVKLPEKSPKMAPERFPYKGFESAISPCRKVELYQKKLTFFTCWNRLLETLIGKAFGVTFEWLFGHFDQETIHFTKEFKGFFGACWNIAQTLSL